MEKALQQPIGHLKNIHQNSLGDTSSGGGQFKIGMNFLAAGGALHKYSADILWNPQ